MSRFSGVSGVRCARAGADQPRCGICGLHTAPPRALAFGLLASYRSDLEFVKFVTEIKVPELLGKFLTVNLWTWETELKECCVCRRWTETRRRVRWCTPGRKSAHEHRASVTRRGFELRDVAASDPPATDPARQPLDLAEGWFDPAENAEGPRPGPGPWASSPSGVVLVDFSALRELKTIEACGAGR